MGMFVSDDQDFSETNIPTADCLVACRLNLYYRMAAQVRRNCARKLLVTITRQATAIVGTPSYINYSALFGF